jgi:hypothetical protein
MERELGGKIVHPWAPAVGLCGSGDERE